MPMIPSALVPVTPWDQDLGECFYEPGSDGQVAAVLTDPVVTTAEVPWMYCWGSRQGFFTIDYQPLGEKLVKPAVTIMSPSPSSTVAC